MCREDSICSCLIEQNENCMCDKRDPDEDMACPTSEPPSTHDTPGWLQPAAILYSKTEESLPEKIIIFVAEEIQTQPVAPHYYQGLPRPQTHHQPL